MFPIIHNIDELRSCTDITSKSEIRFLKQEFGTTFVCYIVSDGDTFTNPLALECRGILFDRDGNILSRPLHKFFNVGEKSNISLDWFINQKGEDFFAFEKIDGSMISACRIDGNLKFHSKRSFKSDVAILCDSFVNNGENKNIIDFCNDVIDLGLTPIFEFMHPRCRIVIQPKQVTLTLLHVRDRVTGEYVLLNKDSVVHNLIEKYKINRPATFTVENGNVLVDSLNGMYNQEGYVVQFKDGNMIKVKCGWYLRLHGAITFLRERDVALIALKEELDDLKGCLTKQDMLLDPINAIEKRVKDYIVEIQNSIDLVVAADKGLSRKEFAIKNKAHKYFPLLMTAYLGQTTNINEWYINHRLTVDFSLNPLGDCERLEGVDN